MTPFVVEIAQSSLCVFALSLVVTLLATYLAIGLLRRLNAAQVIQEDGPQAHKSKAGTPSMGGIAILIGVAAAIPLIRIGVFEQGIKSFAGCYPGFLPVILLALTYAIIGFVDDLLTIRPRNGIRGLSSKSKFSLQFIAAAAFVVWIFFCSPGDELMLPNPHSWLAFGNWFHIDFGWAYIPFAAFFITGMANFVNITDGLDGLAAGLTVILVVVLAGTILLHYTALSAYVYCLVLSALAGACVAFLWFNFNPAKIFMGDTGSLAIGALIPAVAIVMKLEIFMIIAGMVFILDGLSSALQWAVFKYTRITTGTGRRVFRMSPIHHHFELSGWPEQLVVVRFWIAGIVFGLIALLLSALSMMK